MKKLLTFTLSILLLVCSQLHAQEKVTLYYDKDGKGLDSKKKSVFYRIVTFDSDKKPVGIVEDYFPNGKIQRRSAAVYIDKLNNNKCVWKGNLTEYNEKGTKIKDCNYDDQGREDGIETDYNYDGIKTMEAEWTHGNRTKDYYLVYDKKGNAVKYSILDGLPMKLFTSDKVIVPLSERKFRDGQAIEYYFINRISVAIKVSKEKRYGNYYEIYITVENGTDEQFDFDPSEIIAAYARNGYDYGNDNGGYSHVDSKNTDAEVLTYDYYIKKVNRKQKWSAAFNAFAESAAATQAGYSASTQYAASQTGANNVNNYNNQLYSIKQSIKQGYLKINTIMPSTRLIGFVNVKYDEADGIMINVPVNGKVYQFYYTLND